MPRYWGVGHAPTPDASPTHIRRNGTSGVEVYYAEADPAKHHAMQTNFVRVIGPVLAERFGAGRVERRSNGNLQGFLVKLA